ncbi:MAG: RodZ domain-containing protein, partial [Pseudomonadota bacterium]
RERLSSFRLPTISLEKIYPSKDRGVEKKHGPQNLEKTSPEAVKEKAGSDGLAAHETGTGSEGAVEEAPMKKPETAHLSDVPVMEKPSETAVGSSAAALSVQESSSQFPGRATTSPGFPVIEAASPNREPRSPAAATASSDEEIKPAIAETESPAAETESSQAEAASLPSEGLDLQGDVRMRTWLRICIDGQAPREYIFQPGSRPQWRAKEGFYLIIGNAAGIRFQFDGKAFGDLGNLGQVIRLKFPEEYDSSGCGE